MKVNRIFNNNAVATQGENNQEAIVLGNGLGFKKKVGDHIDVERVEKIFYVRDEFQTKFLNMIEDVRPEMLAAAEQIVALSQETGNPITSKGILALIDHIQFAIERLEQKIFVPNLMLAEIKMLYPQEFALGLQSVAIINRYCQTQLPEDEAGYIALHFVNVSASQEQTYDLIKFVNGTLKMIHDYYGFVIDDEHTEILRLTVHLKLLAQRIFGNVQTKDNPIDGMYDYLLTLHTAHPQFLIAFKQYVSKNFAYQITKQEEVYLLVHLSKML